MPGTVTPATIGWNIVSSSCRPRKYHGAFDGFGVELGLASSSSGALTKIEKISRNAVMTSDGHELDRQQVGPHVDLVDRGGLDVLDRARLDHREQALGVPARARSAAGGGAAVATAPPRPAPSSRRHRRRRLGLAAAGLAGLGRLASARAGGPGSCCRRVGRRRRLAAPRRPRRRARRRPPRAALASSAFLRAASARLRRCSGISVMCVSVRPRADRRCRRPCAPARSGWPGR